MMSAPLDFFQYDRSQELCTDGVKLSEIARKIGTPVYVYNASAFLEPLKELKKGLKSLNHLICFAVKSNSSLAILKLLADAGAGMDLVSGGELYRAEKAGVPRDRIVFSGVGKTALEIEAALRAGIFSFNVESLPELKLINAVAMKKGAVAHVALRFNPDVNAKTHPYISTGLKKNKFGLNRQEILEILLELKRLKGISLRGLSIHIGSQLLSLSPLEASFIKLKQLTIEVEKILGHPIRFLDLGGGLGISYETKSAKSPSIKQYDHETFRPAHGFQIQKNRSRAWPRSQRKRRSSPQHRSLSKSTKVKRLPHYRCRHERSSAASALRESSRYFSGSSCKRTNPINRYCWAGV
jgi:diaminopimelate decarboxylase